MNTSSASTGLRSLGVTSRYRSDREDVVSGFYVPALAVSRTYKRAVGYFTSTSLAVFARGIQQFAARGGRMQLIASPRLDAEDIADIDRGYDVRAVIQRAVMRELDTATREEILEGLGLVGRLVAEGRLEVKLAFVEQRGLIGMYHEKIGVFRDDVGDLIAFTGSANETLGGLIANFESVEVYQGWLPGDGPRALRIERDFDDLWSDSTPHLHVVEFPKVARDRLVAMARENPQRGGADWDGALEPVSETDAGPSQLAIPKGLVARPYQRDAVEAWLKAQGRGMMKMATGTGKTKTAMFAACHLARKLQEREEPLVLVIVAPLQHLVDQWIAEVETFGVRPIGVYESSDRWIRLVEEQLAAVRLGQRPVVALVATNDSFAGERFQSILARVRKPILIIADEAHNLGSSAYRQALPANAAYRLALSATPERWFDDEGTAALTDYFGPVVYELGLGQAIDMGALCRYRYLPRMVELTESESDLYAELTRQIAQCIARGANLADPEPDSPLGHLLRKRSGVLGHAEGKIARLRADLEARRESWFQLVYCAEDRRPTDPDAPEGPSQLAEVMDLVGNKLGLSAQRYVAETPRPARRLLMRRFATGDDLRVLVAMRCLDEGVDIPDARVGYLLASSSNPRQFIQRRGRLLRRAPEKEFAEIVDYIAVPRNGTPLNFDIERSLLARELERAGEFGKLAQNYEDALAALRPLKERYHLMHL